MSNTQRLLSGASTERLMKTKSQWHFIARWSFIATPIIFLLGIWVDWRFFPTTVVAIFIWVVANGTTDAIAEELNKRDSADKEPG